MSHSINGKEILEALRELREPATFSTIFKHVAKGKSGSPEEVKKFVQDALEAGVRYGYLETCEDYYYTINDAFDALDEGSDFDDATEIDSMGSMPVINKDTKMGSARGLRPASKTTPKGKKVTIPKKKVVSKTQEEDSSSSMDDDEEFEDGDDNDDDEEEDALENVSPHTSRRRHSRGCSGNCALCRKRFEPSSRSYSYCPGSKRRR